MVAITKMNNTDQHSVVIYDYQGVIKYIQLPDDHMYLRYIHWGLGSNIQIHPFSCMCNRPLYSNEYVSGKTQTNPASIAIPMQKERWSG